MLIENGANVIVIDDLLATGGTVDAAVKLVKELGGEVVGCVCLMELAGLEGRQKLDGMRVETVICYPGN